MTNSSSTVITASPTAPPEVSTTADWEIRWPEFPVVAVHIESHLTEDRFVALGRVTTGDDVTFEQTWTTADSEDAGA